MKYLKMLGLAAVAAMALMAFLGGGSASATVLCKTSLTEGCAGTNWDYLTGTVVKASLASGTSFAILNTSLIPEDTCTGSTLEGKLLTQGLLRKQCRRPLKQVSGLGRDVPKPPKPLKGDRLNFIGLAALTMQQ